MQHIGIVRGLKQIKPSHCRITLILVSRRSACSSVASALVVMKLLIVSRE